MIDEETEMPWGWGILIVEGLNARVAANMILLSVSGVFIAGTILVYIEIEGVKRKLTCTCCRRAGWVIYHLKILRSTRGINLGG